MWHMRVINFFGSSMAASLLEWLPHLFISQYASRKRVKFWQCLVKNTTNSNAVAIICRNSLPFFFFNLLAKCDYKAEIFYTLSAAACGVHSLQQEKRTHNACDIVCLTKYKKTGNLLNFSNRYRLLHTASHCLFHPSAT